MPATVVMGRSALRGSSRQGVGTGNFEGGDEGVVLDGRQQSKSPEPQVSVAGHRAGMLEPEDQGEARSPPRSSWSSLEHRPSHQTPPDTGNNGG